MKGYVLRSINRLWVKQFFIQKENPNGWTVDWGNGDDRSLCFKKTEEGIIVKKNEGSGFLHKINFQTKARKGYIYTEYLTAGILKGGMETDFFASGEVPEVIINPLDSIHTYAPGQYKFSVPVIINLPDIMEVERGESLIVKQTLLPCLQIMEKFFHEFGVKKIDEELGVYEQFINNLK